MSPGKAASTMIGWAETRETGGVESSAPEDALPIGKQAGQTNLPLP